MSSYSKYLFVFTSNMRCHPPRPPLLSKELAMRVSWKSADVLLVLVIDVEGQ